MTAQVLHWNTRCTVKCVLSDLLTIWWTTTVVEAASLVEVSKVCNNYLLHAKVCNKWFNGQSRDAISALWLATGHMISNNISLFTTKLKSMSTSQSKLYSFAYHWILTYLSTKKCFYLYLTHYNIKAVSMVLIW